MGCCLTDRQRHKDQSLYYQFSIFNGISVTFVAENLIILYALKLQVPDYIIGIMSSFIFMSAPFMLLSRPFIKRFGAAKTIAFAWLARYSFAAVFLAAPLIILHYSFVFGVILLICCSFGFYASRNVGAVAWTPVLGEITVENEKSKVISKGFLAYTFAYLISLCLLRFIFEYIDSINTYRAIIAIGCVAGLWAAYTVSRIKETDMPKISAGKSLSEAYRYVKNNRSIAILILLQMIYFSMISLIIPFSMLALKKGYFIQDYDAVTFIIIQMGGSVLISIFGRRIMELIKPRLLVIILFSSFMIVAMLWISAPVVFKWWYCVIIFALMGIARIGGFMALASYFLEVSPPEMRVGINFILSAVSCTAAGVAGAVIGGGMLKYLDTYGFSALNLYKSYFTIMLLLSMVAFILILYLERINPVKTLAAAGRVVVFKRK